MQFAVNVAHNINRHGVLMGDCGSRNVVVNQHSQKPFFIDLAQCCFKDKITIPWEEPEDSSEDDDRYPDFGYWNIAITRDYPGAIGALKMRLRRTNGMELDVTYPDIDKLVNELGRDKEIQ